MIVFRKIFEEQVRQCRSCGFVYTSPRLPPDFLEKYYARDYRLEGLEVPNSLEEFLGDGYKDIWSSKERDLDVVLSVKRKGRLLDVGCASGALLWLAREAGFEVKGVEIGQGAAKFARGVLGLDVFLGQLEQAHFRDREFDVVTMLHSLEHLPNPRRALREIHRVLADDGVLVIVVPNLASWSAQKNGASWKWLQPQNHYSHFTPETIAHMGSLEGFLATIHSEEGRYGEEEIRGIHSPDEIRRIHNDLAGSEIVYVGRKKPGWAPEQRAGHPFALTITPEDE
jgi:SAM-dependent methyltransferase